MQIAFECVHLDNEVEFFNSQVTTFLENFEIRGRNSYEYVYQENAHIEQRKGQLLKDF